MIDFLVSDLFIEILGAVTGIIYLVFSIKQNIWLWPWGIITSLIYVYVFFQSKFYADMSLQFYYLGISIYGWYFWQTGEKPNRSDKLPVIRLRRIEWLIYITVTAIITLIVGFILTKYTDSPLPFWDAFTAGGSVVATWMLARKYLEHWIFWVIIDLVSLGTFVYKDLYPTVVLFCVYTGMAVVGYYQWRKEWLKNSEI